MKGKVIRHVQGKDGVVRGVILLHKGNHIERPIQLVCPLEIRSVEKENPNEASPKEGVDTSLGSRERRQAARDAETKIRLCLQDD